MTKADRKQIAQETIQITKQGFYEKGNKRILLKAESFYSFHSVFVFSPEKLVELEEDKDDFFGKSFCVSKDCEIYLVDADSFEAAEGQRYPLVMNFANAIHPGGGFLNGAIAQEECLCRNSTLYASISSNDASEMYSFNAARRSQTDSDYMLLSPSVCVFRNPAMELLEKPYQVAVMTIAAPNRRGRAASVPQKTLDKVMTDRLRRFFFAAAKYGYRTLVLGAWGCGAFGHDTKRVAGYYYKLLFEEGFHTFFDTIIFAIYKDYDKINAFADVFGEKIENCVMEKISNQVDMEYKEAYLPFPICNHIVDVDESNIGYSQGIFKDGTPFESELWCQNSELNMTVFIPRMHQLECGVDLQGIREVKSDSAISEFDSDLFVDGSVLTVGMKLEGEIEDMAIIDTYVEYLIKNNALRYSSDVRNGSCAIFRDADGNQLMRITICLESCGKLMAETSLHYRSFPNAPERWVFTIRL